MNPRVIGIILIIVGLGVGLYFLNSGGGTKLESVLTHPPGAIAPAASSTSNASTSASGSPNPIAQFFSILFAPLRQPLGPTTIPGSGPAGQGNTQISAAGGSSSIAPSDIPPGLTLAQLSPYFHQVRFDGISTQQIGLYAPGMANTQNQIDITGWEIKTNRSGEFIPQAVNIYNPSAAPVESDIILMTGKDDVVYFYSRSAPVNLRLNECMGFLNQTNQFNPALPSNCPQINRFQISSFTGACQNYILSLGCQPVNMSNTQIPRNDYACQDFLENNFTYDACIRDHASDQNFLSDEWHVWIGQTPLDQYHDNVELLDRSGLVVDAYSY